MSRKMTQVCCFVKKPHNHYKKISGNTFKTTGTKASFEGFTKSNSIFGSMFVKESLFLWLVKTREKVWNVTSCWGSTMLRSSQQSPIPSTVNKRMHNPMCRVKWWHVLMKRRAEAFHLPQVGGHFWAEVKPPSFIFSAVLLFSSQLQNDSGRIREFAFTSHRESS